MFFCGICRAATKPASLRADDPTQGVRLPKAKAGEIHTWTEDEIAQFEAWHSVGSAARLAFALLLYTAQRRGDVVRMGRQHIRDGVLSIRQEKTGTFVEIPVHPTLAAIIAETPIAGQMTFLTSVTGAAFSSAGFGNVFREWCNEADLPKRCSSHGLRKAACRRLAEAGCSEHEIAAISGHESLAEVRRYTRAANRARMAKSAMATVTAAFPEHH
jgi:integrase